MKAIARIGDKWEGICHHPDHSSSISVTGEIITGSGFATDIDKGIARHGDIVEATCGHTDTIIATSNMFDINGIYVARVDDQTTGSPLEGVIVEGSPTSSSE